MQERTTGPGQRPDHAITIEVGDYPAGSPRMRAACDCGWVSHLCPTPTHADAAGVEHLFQPTQEAAVVGAELAESGVAFDDEAGTVTIRRLPWMSDAMWTTVRDGMLAHFEAEGFTREVAR